MTTPEIGTIYGLVDPRTSEIVYVGQTTKPIEIRLAGHLAAPAPLVRAWIEALAIDGQTPQIIPIKENVPAAQLDAVEKEEIRAHSELRDLLNTASNAIGNARRRQASREAAKQRKAEEDAMNQAWQQATWRKVADQIRAATDGPVSPAEIPIRDIPERTWQAYLNYHEADEYLKAHAGPRLLLPPGVTLPGGVPRQVPAVEAASQQRTYARIVVGRYVLAYCRAFSKVDDGEHWGSKEGVADRGEHVYERTFSNPSEMARYLSFIPWAARALEPWVALAEAAGINRKSPEFIEWVSGDQETREAIELYQQDAAGWLGARGRRGDMKVATYMLAVAAAHIPGFVVPELLASGLEERLTGLARDRQATKEMCQLLQCINPKALDVVYGKDELAEADDALGLRSGASADVVRRVFGERLSDPGDRSAKLLQRNLGTFDAVGLPAYSGWSGPHIPGMRVAALSFFRSGLLPGATQTEGDALMEQVRATWLPTKWGLQELEKMEGRSAA